MVIFRCCLWDNYFFISSKKKCICGGYQCGFFGLVVIQWLILFLFLAGADQVEEGNQKEKIQKNICEEIFGAGGFHENNGGGDHLRVCP